MKKLKIKISTLFAIGVVFLPGIAFADFKSDIIKSCTDYQQGIDKSEINSCKLYIDGFIDSSLLSASAVVKPKAMINKDATKQSSFLQRAYQTRVYNSSSSLSTNVVYQFCIPLEYDRKIVASRVAKSLNIDELNEKPLKEILLNSLMTNFPCKK